MGGLFSLGPLAAVLIAVVAALLVLLIVFLLCTWWSFFIEVPKQLARIATALERIQDEDGHASRTIESCRVAHIFTASSLQSSRATSSLRNIPSPEQGASTATTSNQPSNCAKCSGALLVTNTLPIPHLRTLSAKTLARERTYSFATTNPSSPTAVEYMVVLPPGAEHISKTRLPCKSSCEMM